MFLDCDGVLSPLGENGEMIEARLFSNKNMLALKRIIDKTGASIVLSSNWRLDEESRRRVQDELRKYGIPPYFACTGVCSNRRFPGWTEKECRWTEITDWLKRAAELFGLCVTQFVVLDDIDMRYINIERGSLVSFKHTILVDGNAGLTEENADEAITLLNKVK